MPVNIMVGIVGLLVALVLYSIGALGAYRAKTVRQRDVTLLWIGLICDVGATVMMGLSVGGLDLRPGTPVIHTVVALVALVGMAAFAGAGQWALSKGDDALGTTVARWIVAPWVLWVVVFVFGFAVMMPRR
jgi:uncharacterized repeat protein (TIGR03987 family)